VVVAGCFATEQKRSCFGPGRFPENSGHGRPQKIWVIGEPKRRPNDLEQPVPASGIPKPGPLDVHLKDDHLQYAIPGSPSRVLR